MRNQHFRLRERLYRTKLRRMPFRLFASAHLLRNLSSFSASVSRAGRDGRVGPYLTPVLPCGFDPALSLLAAAAFNC